MGVRGPEYLGHLSLLSQVGLEVESPGHTLVLVWDAGSNHLASAAAVTPCAQQPTGGIHRGDFEQLMSYIYVSVCIYT